MYIPACPKYFPKCGVRARRDLGAESALCGRKRAGCGEFDSAVRGVVTLLCALNRHCEISSSINDGLVFGGWGRRREVVRAGRTTVRTNERSRGAHSSRIVDSRSMCVRKCAGYILQHGRQCAKSREAACGGKVNDADDDDGQLCDSESMLVTRIRARFAKRKSAHTRQEDQVLCNFKTSRNSRFCVRKE